MNTRNYIQFYGIKKLHKLPVYGKIDDLLIRPIVSNINTTTYQLAKHLPKVLSLLRESENNIMNYKLNILKNAI